MNEFYMVYFYESSEWTFHTTKEKAEQFVKDCLKEDEECFEDCFEIIHIKPEYFNPNAHDFLTDMNRYFALR